MTLGLGPSFIYAYALYWCSFVFVLPNNLFGLLVVFVVVVGRERINYTCIWFAF